MTTSTRRPLPGVAESVRLLSQVELFRGLTPDALAGLAATVLPRSYDRGQLLFAEGDPGDSLLVLTRGSVSVYRSSPAGDRAVLAVLRPPDVLGEIALLDRAPRSASVEAVEPTTALVLPRTAFVALLRAQPVMFDQLLVSLGTMVRRLTDQAADHVFLDLAGRVAKTLVRLAEAVDTAGTEVVVDVSQGRLAEMVGATRQSVNQVLGGFAARGFLRVEGRRVRLLDRAALRTRAGLAPAEPPLPGAAVSASRRAPGPVSPAMPNRR